MSAKFQIEKVSGQLTPESRAILNALPDGKHDVLTTPTKRYSATRYKHYFDCVLWQILNEAGHHYRIVNLETGEERRPVSTQELHDLVMKPTYNKVLLMAPGKSMLVAGSTTDLTTKSILENTWNQSLPITAARRTISSLSVTKTGKNFTGQTPGSILKTLTKNECNRNKTKTN